MDNQVLVTLIIIICSLSGWYVVLHKYLELKAMLKIKNSTGNSNRVVDSNTIEYAETQREIYSPEQFMDDMDFAEGKHIPGMGPPPLDNMPLHIPREVLAKMKQHSIPQQLTPTSSEDKQSMEINSNVEATLGKRVVCNWASMLHLSGLAIVTGIPFLNVIIPTILWLFMKEQHPYLGKQGREVINFQITFSLILFLCLGAGAVFIWLLPNAAATLFAWTKTVRIVFSTAMTLPFNLFTVLPFFWGCALMVRGAVAAYHGLSFKYPYSQQFVFEGQPLIREQHSQKSMQRKEPNIPPSANKNKTGKVSFG